MSMHTRRGGSDWVECGQSVVAYLRGFPWGWRVWLDRVRSLRLVTDLPRSTYPDTLDFQIIIRCDLNFHSISEWIFDDYIMRCLVDPHWQWWQWCQWLFSPRHLGFVGWPLSWFGRGWKGQCWPVFWVGSAFHPIVINRVDGQLILRARGPSLGSLDLIDCKIWLWNESFIALSNFQL